MEQLTKEELQQEAEAHVFSLYRDRLGENERTHVIRAFEAGYALKRTVSEDHKGYDKLKQATLRDLLKDKAKVNEPYVTVMASEGSATYTRQQLADEVKDETEHGIKILRMLMNLTADQLLRQKI